jgi:hypothetical protein
LSLAAMSGLRVIGAGLPRTGTRSLKQALERLLGGRCYHMHELFANLDHVPTWRAALRGEPIDWPSFLAEYSAGVDWPISAFWRELAGVNPDAVVVLSVRADAETWWQSVDSTILVAARHQQPPEYGEWQPLFLELLEQRLTPDWNDRHSAMSAYEGHNAAVRDAFAERLVEWHADDGWAPLCQALGLPIPNEPFPHLNSREEWLRERRDGAA